MREALFFPVYLGETGSFLSLQILGSPRKGGWAELSSPRNVLLYPWVPRDAQGRLGCQAFLHLVERRQQCSILLESLNSMNNRALCGWPQCSKDLCVFRVKPRP